jgi:hypothetical protein
MTLAAPESESDPEPEVENQPKPTAAERVVPETANSASVSQASSTSCPSCGINIPQSLPPVEQSQGDLLQAHSRIVDLEAQVRLLNQKAAAAVDRWADYEDELSKLREHQTPPPPPPKGEQPQRNGSLLQTSTNRLSALLSRNKSTPNLRDADQDGRQQQGHRSKSAASASDPAVPALPALQPPPPLHPATEDLIKALTRERSLRKEAEGRRKEAEGRLTDTSKEVEELSVTLFEQANEMVAEERRARARLEERVDELERRDVEKRRRLERLEAAMTRIERVRVLLDE